MKLNTRGHVCMFISLVVLMLFVPITIYVLIDKPEDASASVGRRRSKASAPDTTSVPDREQPRVLETVEIEPQENRALGPEGTEEGGHRRRNITIVVRHPEKMTIVHNKSSEEKENPGGPQIINLQIQRRRSGQRETIFVHPLEK